MFFATLDSHVATFVAPLNDIGKICFGVWATPTDCHCEEQSDVAIPTLRRISIEDALSGQEKVRLTEPQVKNLLCGRGQSIPYKDAKNVLLLTPDGDTYGLGDIENGQIRITAFLLD